MKGLTKDELYNIFGNLQIARFLKAMALYGMLQEMCRVFLDPRCN